MNGNKWSLKSARVQNRVKQAHVIFRDLISQVERGLYEYRRATMSRPAELPIEVTSLYATFECSELPTEFFLDPHVTAEDLHDSIQR